MPNTISNPSQFPVFVAELGKMLAPHEAITVTDPAVVARHVQTGVLSDEHGEHDAEAVARWHDEHQTASEQIVKPGESVDVAAKPVEDADEPVEAPAEHAPAEHAEPDKPPVATRKTVKGREVNRAPRRETR